MLETGYESTMELLVWRQLKGAWQVPLVLVPRDFPTMEDALEAHNDYKKVFFIPPGRIESTDFRDFTLPEGDVLFIFGRPQENLVRFVQESDDVVSIHTPGKTDMMAISVVGIALNEFRQQNNHK